VAELSKEVGVHGVTLRYHLGLLMAQGLVESGAAPGTRRKGRPATLYRLSNRTIVPGYPERHFDLLARISLATLVETVGEETASGRLRRRGSLMGRFLITDAAAKAHIDRWTPEAFERVVLNGLFPDFGIACEVVSREPDRLTYRSFTCPFLEIATEVPALVCDALDGGFHAGIDEALGGARTERIACMGHGEAHCEYRVSWTRRSRAPTSRDAGGRRRSAGSSRGGSRGRPGAKVGSRFPDGQRRTRRSS
jgi:predicted ArsR family transcriptional regulator